MGGGRTQGSTNNTTFSGGAGKEGSSYAQAKAGAPLCLRCHSVVISTFQEKRGNYYRVILVLYWDNGKGIGATILLRVYGSIAMANIVTATVLFISCSALILTG